MHGYELDYAAWEQLLAGWGESRQYARAIWRALYREGVTNASALSDLPASLRARLAAEMTLAQPRLLARQEAPDGRTRKELLELADGARIEVVRMRYGRRVSGCISTQVGCACGCSFCATGQMGLVRDLTVGEIIAQVLHLRRELVAEGEELSNFVLMGMGEPLLNYEHTLAAVRHLTEPRGLGFAPRRITLSTAGIAPGIRRLAAEPLPLRLAVSLHAATDALRSELMPINRRYPLAELRAALGEYATATGRRVLLEWVLIAGQNDTLEQAESLAGWIAGLDAHVNLMRLNPTAGSVAQPAETEALERFAAVLDQHRIPHTVRQRRGLDIEAGCGQLWQAQNEVNDDAN